jgi:hypothetical protein
MLVIGDIHGNIKMANKIAYRNPDKLCIVAGDVGLMPLAKGGLKADTVMEKNLFFIRGNHDCPTTCNDHFNYLGDYGYFPFPRNGGFFFLGGAPTLIGRTTRSYGVDLFSAEELDRENLEKAFELYKYYKPDVVITHEAPDFTHRWLLDTRYPKPPQVPTTTAPTSTMLGQMWRHRQPKLWIHGHWHLSYERDVGDTRFIGLDCDEVKEIL